MLFRSQVREAFPWDEAPRYLIHDRDHAFDGLGATAKAMGIDEVLTAPHAPWQNPFVERFIGSARRECVDHVIVFNESGLRRLMTRYCSYYERSRTHLALDKDTPIPRPVTPPGDGAVVRSPRSGASIIGTNGARPERARRRLDAHERSAPPAGHSQCGHDNMPAGPQWSRDRRDTLTSSPPFNTSKDDLHDGASACQRQTD